MQLPAVSLAIAVLIIFEISAVQSSCSDCVNHWIWPFERDSLLVCAEKCGAGKFVTKVKAAGLEDEFNNKASKSLFAPLDADFSAIPEWVTDQWANNPALLRATLRYHLTSQRYHISDLNRNNMLIPTHNPDASERVNVYTGGATTTVNGYKFDTPSRDLHKDGNVFPLHGCFYKLPTLTIFDTIATNNTFTILRLAVTKANLETQLEGANLTMFAPTDSAFRKLPPGLLVYLLNNLDKLADVVRGHVVKGVYYSVGLPNKAVLMTMAGRNVTITTTPGHLKVNNATVVDADFPAGNGVLHAIDTVLM